MLRKVKITGFQIHKESVLEFSPGINYIIGSGDMGKSSIGRALRWALANSLPGNNYINNDMEEAKVQLFFDDCTITRIRDRKTKNQYVLNKAPLKAIGRGPVDLIMNAHRINPALSFQGQHDGPFLLSWSEQEASRFLNKLIDLDKMDACQKFLNAEYRALQTITKQKEAESQELKESVKRLKWVSEAQKLLGDISHREKSLLLLRESLQGISAIVEEVEKSEQQLEKFSPLKKAEIQYSDISGYYDEIIEAKKTNSNLLSLITSLKKDTEKLKSKEQTNEALKAITQKINEAAKINDFKNKKTELKNCIVQVNETKKKLEQTLQKVATLHEKGKEFKICPLCGTPGFDKKCSAIHSGI